jgi:hypothetical protein
MMIQTSAMMRVIIAALFYSTAAATSLASYQSPCECLDNHTNHPRLPVVDFGESRLHALRLTVWCD